MHEISFTTSLKFYLKLTRILFQLKISLISKVEIYSSTFKDEIKHFLTETGEIMVASEFETNQTIQNCKNLNFAKLINYAQN